MADVTLNIRHNADQATGSVRSLSNEMDRFASSSRRATNSGNAVASGFRKIGLACLNAGKSASQGASGISKFVSSLGRIAYYRLIRTAIKYVGKAFTDGLQAAIAFSKASRPNDYVKLADAMDNLKNSASIMSRQLGAALGDLLVAVTPILLKIINLVTAAANALTRFFAVLNGSGWYQQAVAGFDDVGDSAGGAGKKMKGLLASWDELNVIGKESGGGGGSSTPDYSGAYEWVEAQSDWADLFASGDFFGIGAKIGDALGNISKKITEFLKKPEIQNFGKNLADLLNGSVSKPENWENFGEAIGTAIGTAAKWIIDFFDNVDWPAVKNAIKAFLDGVWKGLKQELDEYDFSFDKPYWEVIIDKLFGEGSWESITPKKIWEKLFGSGGSENGGISIDAKVEVGLIKKGWNTVSEWVKKNIGGAVAKGVGLVKSGWTYVADWVKKYIGGAVAKGVGLAKSGWATVSDWVKKYIGGAVAKGVGLAKSGWTFVSDWVKKSLGPYVAKGVGLAKSSWTTVAEWVKKSLGTAVSKGISLVKNGWKTVSDWIKDPKAFGTAVAKGIGLVKNGWVTVQTWIQSGKMGNAVNKGIGLVKNGWATVQTWIQDGKLGNAVNKGVGLLKSGWDTVASWINRSYLGGVVSKTVSLTVSFVENAGKKLFEAWNSLKSKTVSLSITASNTFKSAWNSVVKFLNKWFGTHFSTMAEGGFVDRGQLFIAREAGPELVGTMGGQTAVANNDQIVAGIQSGVAQANAEQNALLRQQNSILVQLLNKEFTVSPSVSLGQVMARSAALYGRA